MLTTVSGAYAANFAEVTSSNVYWDNTTYTDGTFYARCIKNGSDSTSFNIACISMNAGDTLVFTANSFPDAKIAYYKLLSSDVPNVNYKFTLGQSYSYTADISRIVRIEAYVGSSAIPNGTVLQGSVYDYFTLSGMSDTSPSVQGFTTIEAGNIVYFDLGTNKPYDISMQSSFYSYSGVLSGTWPDDNRRYGFVDELPTANANFAESVGTSILWSDDTDGQTILGTNNKGVATISGTTSGRYMWVINPLYNNKYYDDALNAKAINGVMKVYGVPAGTTVYTYKLKQNATSLGLDNVIPSVSGGVGTVSENEGQETPFTSTDDNETPYTQTVGGDTSAPETVTAIEGVRQTLQQFVDMFFNLLTAPADYIQQLISAGSAFMQAITGIFIWLPNSVVDVFTSALILLIVIGVLKMLL